MMLLLVLFVLLYGFIFLVLLHLFLLLLISLPRFLLLFLLLLCFLVLLVVFLLILFFVIIVVLIALHFCSPLQTLLPAASLLQLNGVRDACCKFLLSQLDPSNCLGIRGFADTHSCSDLLKSAHKYVLQHFVEVSKTEEFMLLPLKQVSNDKLKLR